jgi:hypothetical protein
MAYRFTTRRCEMINCKSFTPVLRNARFIIIFFSRIRGLVPVLLSALRRSISAMPVSSIPTVSGRDDHTRRANNGIKGPSKRTHAFDPVTRTTRAVDQLQQSTQQH